MTTHRFFTLLCFTDRLGYVHVHDTIVLPLCVTEQVTRIVIDAVRREFAKGHQVLVVEGDKIKADWSHLTWKAFHALETLPKDDYNKASFLPIANIWSIDIFKQVMRESFPEHARQH